MFDINMEYYKVFYSVGCNGSISKAAEELSLSQPAVTHSVKQLETAIGCSLFLRMPRGMKLTAEGEELFKAVSSAFNIISDGESTVARMIRYEEGTLNIGATETALKGFLLPLLSKFQEKYPGVFVNLGGTSTKELVDKTRQGAVDFSVGVSPVYSADDLTVIPLIDFQDIFVCGEKFKKSFDSKKLSAEDLCAYPIVCAAPNTSIRGNAEHYFASIGLTFNPAYSVITSSSVIPFVLNNLAIGILPEMFAKEIIKRKEAYKVKTNFEIPKRKIVLIYRKQEKLSRLSQLFLDFAKINIS